MKMSVLTGVALSVAAFSLSGVLSTANAELPSPGPPTYNHAGTICRNYNAAQATDIDYLTTGVRNLNASPRYVVCPIVFAPQSALWSKVYVTGYSNPGSSITCTLYSYDENGNFQDSASFTEIGHYYSPLLLNADFTTVESVLCLLPGNAGGVIYQLEAQPPG